MKTKTILLAMLVVLVAGAAAQADLIIYQQNFSGYADGTLLTAVPGWYDAAAGRVPVIVGGKAVNSAATPAGSRSMFLDVTNIFGYGNTTATIEFDSLSYQQEDWRIVPGTASLLTSVGSQTLGLQHGAERFYTRVGGAWAPGQVFPTPANPVDAHWLWTLTKTGGDAVSFTATYNGLSAIVTSPQTLNITDVRGLNTFRWYFLGVTDSTLDNIVIKALGVGGQTVIPEPAGLGLIGAALLMLKRRRS